MIVTAVPLKHKERLTVTRVVLGIRPQVGGSASHKLTGSSLCTQLCTNWLQHITVTDQQSISVNKDSRSRVLTTQALHQESKPLIWLQQSAQSVNRYKDAAHDLVATTDTHHSRLGTHTRTQKGLQARQSERVYAPKTWPYKSRIKNKNVSHSL